ncbi:SGNH esterase [Rhodococcus phage Mbo4]|nr:SGNH/GDSL hydrolase family protein [Rhodococcus opacus]YP_010755930.1 SGNH esterase [Rhodococcus phage Mbo4]URG17515.1 SGNH esterase [Rhodococcus phage Mbo4]
MTTTETPPKRESKRERRERLTNRWVAIAVAATAAVTIAGVGYDYYRMDSVQPTADTRIPSPEYLGPTTELTEPKPLATILPKLKDPNRPFNVVVFGDSTGVSSKGWQVLVPTWLGQTFDRKTSLLPWNKDEHRYDPIWNLRSGTRAPITVYNASAPGKNVAYATEHIDQMVPLTPNEVDLVFVNFSHTEPIYQAPAHVGDLMNHLAETYPDAAISSIQQNPDWIGSNLQYVQEQNTRQINDWATYRGFPTMPVRQAFFDCTDDINTLLDEPTKIHPNPEGYLVWSKVVAEELIKAGVPTNVPVPQPTTCKSS